MMPVSYRIKFVAIVVFVAVAANFCASKNFLVVNYQLPSETIAPGDPAVSLNFEDKRAIEAIATKSAKMALKDFSGNFALIVARDKNNQRLVGAFSLGSMIRTIFKQRLEKAGMRIAPEDQPQPTAIEIILKEFKLDLVNRKWVVHMTYQANLIKQKQFVTGETITGSAERLRVVGNTDAEMVISELITDAVNRLNISELLRAGGV